MAVVPKLLRLPVRRGLIPSLGVAKPNVLWFGCSSSGFQEARELELMPGEIIEHRNLGNLLSNQDLSTSSTVEYALTAEQVNHIVICGHYGCSFLTPDSKKSDGVDSWLKDVRKLYESWSDELEKIEDVSERQRLFAELYTWSQSRDVLNRKIVMDAMDNQGIKVHAFIYDDAKKECLQLTTS
ncbi:carbonic anhydrase [Eremomyces bilateralis CBS 781.70]|uniref:Carbonic anhydrase n=1 Tax=Eremomyces bilateralis CBS 781.70 TaxID=1392243 RepID=A0A6G1GH02_9PEZI|nr:carbonic anhydrase [Eremomyces bilateralis CBS 781.70]KAF1817216.1 carbonic anhydrase [Eremomyces bilateralis CBS 781.70]